MSVQASFVSSKHTAISGSGLLSDQSWFLPEDNTQSSDNLVGQTGQAMYPTAQHLTLPPVIRRERLELFGLQVALLTESFIPPEGVLNLVVERLRDNISAMNYHLRELERSDSKRLFFLANKVFRRHRFREFDRRAEIVEVYLNMLNNGLQR